MSGEARCPTVIQGHLTGVLSGIVHISGELTVPKSTDEREIYDGEYTVTPRPYEAVILETQSKVMTDDVTVREIPYYTTTNLSGGYTAIIGG